MYPDRTLFSLLPTINEGYNGREEYNWDWVLTYPYKKRYTNKNGKPYDFFEKGKGLRVIWHMTESLTVEGSNHDFLKKPNGDTLVTRNSGNVFFRTKMKHGLEIGDAVRIIADNKDEFICRVANVGDINGLLPEYYFALSYDDIADGWGEEKTYILNATIDSVRIPQNIFVSKVVNGLVCDYYIRDFKIIDGLKSDIQKAGFSKTIFGDPVAQIIYSNNLNVYGLKDHNGRDISEIYLTLVKRNKGYNEWYLSGVTHPVYVERSHCFGEVTSGFEFELEHDEMVEFDMVKDYNVRMLYNINTTDDTYLDNVDVPFNIPKSLERNLSVESTEVFCGDFIEFSPSTVLERTLSEVYHRFNTAQREVINPSYIFDLKKIKYDEIMYDDYDFLGDDMGPAGFKINIKRGMGENVSDKRWNSFNPEGYFYKPHHKIQIKEESTIVSYDFDLQLAVLKDENGNKLSKNEDGLRYELNVSGSYALLTNDKIVLLYKDRTYIEGVVNEVKDNKVIFSSEPIKDLNPWRVFLKNKTVPSYAYYSGDGSGKRMWRKILLESELNQDSGIYERPYANGAIYLHDDINFYVRRQDPDGRYGLQYIYERVGDYANFTISGNKKDMPDVDYKTIESNTQCEL
jgi:hypothetical protein